MKKLYFQSFSNIVSSVNYNSPSGGVVTAIKEENKMNEITKKIKDYMKEKELLQQEMAKLLDITITHMSKIMNEHQSPGSKTTNNYYKLPGIKEGEAIQRTKQIIDDLWLSGTIDEQTAKKLAKTLKYDS